MAAEKSPEFKAGVRAGLKISAKILRKIVEEDVPVAREFGVIDKPCCEAAINGAITGLAAAMELSADDVE